MGTISGIYAFIERFRILPVAFYQSPGRAYGVFAASGVAGVDAVLVRQHSGTISPAD